MRMVPKYFTDGKQSSEATVLQTPDDFVVVNQYDGSSNPIWFDPEQFPRYTLDEVIHELNSAERHIYEVMREVASHNLLPAEGEWKGFDYQINRTRECLAEVFRMTARTYVVRPESRGLLNRGVYVVNFVDFVELIKSLKPEQGTYMAGHARPLSDFVQTIPFVR